jgi:D-arabinose 1-dehydrogenase-like Zn-dependent alcohol dehydrogenase
MRAFGIRSYGIGGTLVSLERPDPGPPRAAEVQIRLRATSINRIDRLIAQGFGAAVLNPLRRFPLVLGRDGVGQVTAIGSKALGIAVDQRVIFAVGAQRAGTYAERVNLPARCVCPIAPTLSDEDAAGLGYAGTIAVKALDVLGIRTRRARGRRLLIHGASTGVGAIAIQLARSRGAKVTGLCPSESHTWVRSLGASETVESGDAQAIGNLRADAVLRCTPPFADDPLQDTLVATLVHDGVDPSYACVWPQLRALCGEPGWLRGALGGVESLARRVRFSRVRHHWVWFNEGSDSLRDVGAFFATADAQPVTGCRFALAALPTIFNDPAAVLPTARGKTCFTI